MRKFLAQFLAYALFVGLLTIVAVLGNVAMVRAVTAPANDDPIGLSPQACVSQSIHALIHVGATIPKNTPNYHDGLMRTNAGQDMCHWAILCQQSRPAYAVQAEQACAAIHVYWEEQQCPACGHISPAENGVCAACENVEP